MTVKRYDVIDKEEPRGQSVTDDGIPCTARHCCTVLNRLTEENEQLKQFIQSLAEQSVNGKVMLRDGKVYDLNKILKKGDVE